jgi:hypothetical protein
MPRKHHQGKKAQHAAAMAYYQYLMSFSNNDCNCQTPVSPTTPPTAPPPPTPPATPPNTPPTTPPTMPPSSP